MLHHLVIGLGLGDRKTYIGLAVNNVEVIVILLNNNVHHLYYDAVVEKDVRKVGCSTQLQ